MPTTFSWTPTQRRMLAVLADGQPHHKSELQACLPDELSTIYMHVSNIRAKLRPQGQDIICEYRHQTIYYRHVRLLSSPYKE